MKKFLISILFLILTCNIFSWEQENQIPQPLKVLYPFSIQVRFDKPFNLIKAHLDKPDNLLISDEDQWTSTLTDSLNLTLMALKPGEIKVPEIKIITYDELGADTLFTKSFDILVTAVSDSSSQLTDIKPIQPSKAAILMETQFAWVYKLIKYLVIIIVIIFFLYLLYHYYPSIRDSFLKNKLSQDTVKLLPWEYALQELQVIKDRMLLVPGKEYLFSIELSLLMRRFLEKYYMFPAAERTTSELKRDFKSLDIKEKDKLIEILVKLDQVKYTKGKLSENLNTDNIYQWFRDYLADIKSFEEKKVQEMEVKK